MVDRFKSARGPCLALEFNRECLEELKVLDPGCRLLVPSFVRGSLIYPDQEEVERPLETVFDGLPETSPLGCRPELTIVTAQPTGPYLTGTLRTLRRAGVGLAQESVEERIELLARAAEAWPGSYEYAIVAELLPRISSRSPGLVREELDTLGRMLSGPSLRYMAYGSDGQEADHLRRAWDGWVEDGPRTCRHVPHGVIYENLAGNSALMSWMWIEDLLAGNAAVVKTGEDWVSHVALAHLICRQSPALGARVCIFQFPSQIRDDPGSASLPNPLYRTIFPEDGDVLVDAVGSSGGLAAVRAMRQMAPAWLPLFENGPKYSGALLLFPEQEGMLSVQEIEAAVRSLVHFGVCLHEQEACASMRLVGIIGHEVYHELAKRCFESELQRLAEELPKIYRKGEGILFNRWAGDLLVGGNVSFRRSKRKPDWAVVDLQDLPSVKDLDGYTRRVVAMIHSSLADLVAFWAQPSLKGFTQTMYVTNLDPMVDTQELCTALAVECGFTDIYDQHTLVLHARAHDGQTMLRKTKLVHGPRPVQFGTDRLDTLEQPLLQWLATEAFAPEPRT